MADEIEETDDDAPSDAMIVNKKEEQRLRVSELEVSPAKSPEPQTLLEPNVILDESPPEVTTKNRIVFQFQSNGGDEKLPKVGDEKKVTSNRPRQPRGACRARSRDTRQCQKHFQEMIGKHETRKDELEQREGDLRQRMEMLECSTPAVMTWNIWRMSQNASASTVRRLLEKQFKDHGGDGLVVPSTPSQHYDCRVREIESERKKALRRAEEARVLLAEKEAAVEERKKLLEDAKKCNQERREKIEKLNLEATELRSVLKKARGDDNSCEIGECGQIQCRGKWLENVGSVSSIGSTDLECFAKLQELAEAEICMKQQISELERREEAYMRTLQQADELWLKMEGDTADTVSELQCQLDSKAAANQQLADRICSLEDELEKSKTRLISCKDALLKFTDKKFSDVEIGFDDGEATVTDHGVIAAVKTAAVSTLTTPTIAHQETLAIPEVTDKESSVLPETADANPIASVKMSDKYAEAIIDQIHRGVDRPTGLGIDANVGDEELRIQKTEDLIVKTGAKADEDDEVLSNKWKDWDWDEGCPPDAICNNVFESSMGTSDLEHPKSVPTTLSEVQATPEVVDQKLGGRDTRHSAAIEAEVDLRLTDASHQAAGIPTMIKTAEVTKGTAGTVLENDQIVVSREELRNWYNVVDSVQHLIIKCVNCSSKMDDIAHLADRMKLHLQIKGLSGVKKPTMVNDSAGPEDAIHSAKRSDENESSAVDDVRKIADDFNSLSVEEQLTSGVISETLLLPSDRITSKITGSDDPIHPVEHENETESSALGDVQKIDDDFNLFSVKVEQYTSGVVSETSVSSKDRITSEFTGPDELIHPVKHGDETEPFALGDVPKIPDDLNSFSVKVQQSASGVLSKTLESSKDRITSKITGPDNSIHSVKHGDETESSALGGVQQIVEEFKSVPIEAEQLASSGVRETLVLSEDRISPEDTVVSTLPEQPVATNDVSQTLVFSENGISPEVRGDFKLPPEAVMFDTMTEVSGIKPPNDGQLDVVGQISQTSEQPTGVSKEKSSEETMLVTTQQDLSKEEPKEIAKFVDDDRKTFLELQTIAPTVREDIVVKTDREAAESTDIPIDETLTHPIESSEKLAKALSGPMKLQVVSRDSEELSTVSLRVSDEVEIKQPVVIPEIPVDVEESKSEVDKKEDARVEETAVSFVTPRTPPPSRMDVQFRLKTDDIADDNQQTSDSIDESLIKFEELDRAEEIPQQETPSQSITKVEDTPEYKIEQVTPKIPEFPDESRLDVLADKVPDKISSKERIAEAPKVSIIEASSLPVASNEFVEKVKLSKAFDRCICKPRTCPLLRRIASSESKLKAPKLFTEGTQTSPQVPRSLVEMLDKLKLKTITESSTWPSPEVTIWRRPMVWSKRPRDKSALTTSCVDTQTDSALARKRIVLEGIDRNAHTTCSGVHPRYIDSAGCRERISPQPSVPVGRAVAELFDDSVRLPASVASSAKKEIAVVKYEGRSLMPQDSERHCDCGRPIIPDSTPLSENLRTSTRSKSQRSITASLNKISSFTCRLSRKNNALSCCTCKALDNRKVKESNETCKRGTIEKSSEKTTSDNDACCSCPADITKIMPRKSSKSRKKKQKPEKKDQCVMAVIPRSKLKPLNKESRNDATALVTNTEHSSHCVSSEMRSKMKSSLSTIKITSNARKVSECICSEDSTINTSLTKHSSCSKKKIVENDNNDNLIIAKSLIIENMCCDNSSIDSVLSKEGACNCLPPTP